MGRDLSLQPEQKRPVDGLSQTAQKTLAASTLEQINLTRAKNKSHYSVDNEKS